MPSISHGDGDLWNRVIDSLEQNHPQYLADLLRTNSLEKVIEQRIQRYGWRLNKAQQIMPDQDESVHDEMAREALGDVNPNWQDEEPLTAEEQKLLQAFQEKHSIEP